MSTIAESGSSKTRVRTRRTAEVPGRNQPAGLTIFEKRVLPSSEARTHALNGFNQPGSKFGPVKIALRNFACASTHGSKFASVIRGMLQRIGKSDRIAGRDGIAAFVFRYDVGDPAGIIGQHRFSPSERIEELVWRRT